MYSKLNINAAPQNKVIQFEARPVWETAVYAKALCGSGSTDEQRKQNYPAVKDILSDYTRVVVQKALNELNASDMSITIDNLRLLYHSKGKDKNSSEKYTRACTALKNHVVSIIKKYCDDCQLFNKGDLFNHRKSLLLQGTYYPLTEAQKDIIQSYMGMTSYFDKYFTNLSTIVLGTEQGSIAYRIIECLEQYFQNEVLLNKYADEIPGIFETSSFTPTDLTPNMMLLQSGIDKYNGYMGTLCSAISQYRQTNKALLVYPKKINKLPLMNVEKKFVIKSIEDKEQLGEAVNAAIMLGKQICDFAKTFIAYQPNEEKGQLLINYRSYAQLSLKLYGKYNTLSYAISEYNEKYGTTLSAKKEMSMWQLEQIIELCNTASNMPLIAALKEDVATGLKSAAREISINKYIKDNQILAHKKELKEYLDGINLIRRALAVFFLGDGDVTCEFIENLYNMQSTFSDFITAYNIIRNFCTKSQLDKSTYPVTFNKSTFMNSLDADKFREGISISCILRRNGMFYLLVLNPSYTTKIPASAYTTDKNAYELLEYKQLTGINKMFPKVFMAKSTAELYQPDDEIKHIVANKLYAKAANDRASCIKWIKFCIESYSKHPEWSKLYNVTFKQPEEYESCNDFYTQIEKATISLQFNNCIGEKYLREQVARGNLFLFQIYSKSFSPNHYGKIDEQAKLLKECLSDENLEIINKTLQPCVKLCSGGNSLVYRKASIPMTVTHPAGQLLKAKNPNNPNKERTLNHDLYKDKRYMTDKYILSLCVQIGFRNDDVLISDLNRKVNSTILKEKPNIISLRVGERHMLYYCVLSPDKKILEQGSLNVINTKCPNGTELSVDYKTLLNKKATEINNAKEEWNYSVPIASVKAGYLSAALHQIILLCEKWDGIICIEGLDSSFMQSRMANSKSIYQQFQKMLINKLSCYIKTGTNNSEAKQYCCRINAYSELKGQNGIIYFIKPQYTSKCDPVTGFVDQFYPILRFETKTKAVKVLHLFEDVVYNSNNKCYDFIMNAEKLGAVGDMHTWTLTTSGERWVYKDKKYLEYNCTEKITELFNEYHISCFMDIKTKDLPKDFYMRLFDVLTVMLTFNYYAKDIDDEYMLSPVRINGTQFDSRNSNFKCTAAVKTYMLALKCCRELELISDETLLIARDKKGTSMANWIKYLQSLV